MLSSAPAGAAVSPSRSPRFGSRAAARSLSFPAAAEKAGAAAKAADQAALPHTLLSTSGVLRPANYGRSCSSSSRRVLIPRATRSEYRHARLSVVRCSSGFEVRPRVPLPESASCSPSLQAFVTPAVAVAACGAFFNVYDRLGAERLNVLAATLKADLKEMDVKADLTELKADSKEMKEDMKDLRADLKEMLLALAGVPRVARSLGKGLKQAEAGEPLTALAAALPAEVEMLLDEWGLGQYSSAGTPGRRGPAAAD